MLDLGDLTAEQGRKEYKTLEEEDNGKPDRPKAPGTQVATVAGPTLIEDQPELGQNNQDNRIVEMDGKTNHGHIAQEIQHGSEVVHSSPTSVDKIKDLTVPIRKVSHSSPITAESNGDFTVHVRKIPPGRQNNGLGIVIHPTVDDNHPYTHVGLNADQMTNTVKDQPYTLTTPPRS